jgi:hypothetical protein
MVVWVVTRRADYDADEVVGAYSAQELAESVPGLPGDKKVYRCEVDVDDSVEEV